MAGSAEPEPSAPLAGARSKQQAVVPAGLTPFLRLRPQENATRLDPAAIRAVLRG